MRFLRLLKQKPLCNELHFILIAVLLLMLSIRYYFFFIFFAIYFIYLFKKKLVLIPALIVIFILIFRITAIKIKTSLFKEKSSYTAYVIDVKDENSYIIYVGVNKILIYDYEHDVKPGDTVKLSFKINENKKSYLTDFDYGSYLLSRGISFSGKATSREIKSHGFSFNSTKYYYFKYLKKNLSEDSYNYVLAMSTYN